jgi:hypothetical protein
MPDLHSSAPKMIADGIRDATMPMQKRYIRPSSQTRRLCNMTARSALFPESLLGVQRIAPYSVVRHAELMPGREPREGMVWRTMLFGPLIGAGTRAKSDHITLM